MIKIGCITVVLLALCAGKPQDQEKGFLGVWELQYAVSDGDTLFKKDHPGYTIALYLKDEPDTLKTAEDTARVREAARKRYKKMVDTRMELLDDGRSLLRALPGSQTYPIQVDSGFYRYANDTLYLWRKYTEHAELPFYYNRETNRLSSFLSERDPRFYMEFAPAEP